MLHFIKFSDKLIEQSTFDFPIKLAQEGIKKSSPCIKSGHKAYGSIDMMILLSGSMKHHVSKETLKKIAHRKNHTKRKTAHK